MCGLHLLLINSCAAILIFLITFESLLLSEISVTNIPFERFRHLKCFAMFIKSTPLKANWYWHLSTVI